MSDDVQNIKVAEICDTKPASTKNKITDVEVAQKMIQLRQSSISRSLDFNLSFRTVKFLLTQKKCYYTGIVFEDSGDNARSIDRVDSTKGYIEVNVVACTVGINSKKNNITITEIEQIYKGVKRKFKS
jgi:hypothetical protein